MADIELVIKIPEEQYNTIKSDLYNTFPTEMRKWGLEAIRNGTPLHKVLVKTNGIIDYFGRRYVCENPVLKTIDKNGVCSFYGFKECEKDGIDSQLEIESKKIANVTKY